MVEVCAIVYSPSIDCPIAFPFNVHLSISDSTAGNNSMDSIRVCVCVRESERIKEPELIVLTLPHKQL